MIRIDYKEAFFQMATRLLRVAEENDLIEVAKDVLYHIEAVNEPKTTIPFARELLKEFTMPIIREWAADFLERWALQGAEISEKPEVPETKEAEVSPGGESGEYAVG